MKRPKVLSKKTKFKGKWFRVVSEKIQLTNGKIVEWDFPVAHDAVSIVALDDAKNIYLSEEWRPAWGKNVLMIPAGGVNSRASEKERVQQARNELREEIGMDCRKIVKLGTFMSMARTRLRHHLYLATGLFKSPKKGDPDEILKIVKMPFLKAFKLFLNGKKETTIYTMLSLILVKDKLGIK